MSRRRRGERRPRGAAEWSLLAILLAASAFVTWEVVKTSWAEAFSKTSPIMAAQLSPRDPRVPIALAMLEFRLAGGAIRPGVRQKAVEALDRAPLSDEPFFIAGMDALVAGDAAKAERLMAEARRRNPRGRYARLILLDRYLRTGKIDQATGEMTALGGLIPGAGGHLTKELGRLALAPATSAALEKALQQNPEQRDALLEHLADTGASPELILRLARNVPASGPAARSEAWQSKLVSGLVVQGKVDQAYGLWRTFSSAKAPARKAGLYDPGLQGLPGFAPFNWYYPTTPAGVAERSPTGLQVEYYGRDNAELAGQLLMLAPGRYRLAFTAEGSADGESSRISWQMQCLQSKAVIGELILSKVDYSPRRIAGDFTVPAQGCSAQWLRLTGKAAEFVKPQNVTIRGLQLGKVG